MLNQTGIESKFKVIKKIIELNHHPTPTLTQLKHQTRPGHFVVTRLELNSTDEPLFVHQWGSITFCNPISGLKYKTNF